MADPLTLRVAANVRAEMARKGVTQQQLSPLVGISQQALSRRLRGEYPIDTAELEAIAMALGISVDQLLTAPERVA